MGNEMSTTEYEGPPELLEGRDIPSIAKYIKSDQCKNIFVMVCSFIMFREMFVLTPCSKEQV